MLATVAGLFGTKSVALTLFGEAPEVSQIWVAASSVDARLAQDLEYTLGEGPARESAVSRRAIVERGPMLQIRWQHYGPALRRIGISAVAAVPLAQSRTREASLGALTVFNPDLLALGSLRAVARDLAVAVLDEEAGRQRAMLAHGDLRPAVHQAAGVVSVQCGCGVSEALVLMRAYSYAHGESIDSVAGRVLRHELRLD